MCLMFSGDVWLLFDSVCVCPNVPSPSQALMSLFVLASKDGWVDIMYDGLDAVGVDQQVITYCTVH